MVIELQWYNWDEAGWNVLGTFNLSGTTTNEETFKMHFTVTLVSGSNSLGYTVTTFLDMRDQANNQWMLRRNNVSVSPDVTGDDQTIYLRTGVKLQTTGDFMALEHGNVRVMKEH